MAFRPLRLTDEAAAEAGVLPPRLADEADAGVAIDFLFLLAGVPSVPPSSPTFGIAFSTAAPASVSVFAYVHVLYVLTIRLSTMYTLHPPFHLFSNQHLGYTTGPKGVSDKERKTRVKSGGQLLALSFWCNDRAGRASV